MVAMAIRVFMSETLFNAFANLVELVAQDSTYLFDYEENDVIFLHPYTTNEL